MRALKKIIAGVAILVGLALFMSGPGTRLGLWEYGTGLMILRNLALPALITAAAAGLSLFAALITARDLVPLLLMATLIAGAAGAVPLQMRNLVQANPFIHDVTTDFDNPPKIVAAAGLKRNNPPEYLGDDLAPRSDITISETQKHSFPDITPKVVTKSLEDTAADVRAILTIMKIEVLAEDTLGNALRIEGVYTSTWFGFSDDFIVRLTPVGDDTRIDVRSKSRVGGSDLGANAKRIRQFFQLIDEKT